MQHYNIVRQYDGHAITYQDDGWFNATAAAAKWGKRVDHWLANQDTKNYIDALCEVTNTRLSGYLKTKRGVNGGTWLHPKLAIRFAQWLDPKFAVWCDMQIDEIIRGSADHKRSRHMTVATSVMMHELIQQSKVAEGKDIKPYHFSNEHLMVNTLLTGKRDAVNRDALTIHELNLLGQLELRNSMMIAKGIDYHERKSALAQYAANDLGLIAA